MSDSVGVCILTYNSAKYISGALQSTAGHDCGLPLRVIVVDNQSVDGTAALVRKRFPGIDVIETGANLGFAKGNNIGARRLIQDRCSYVVFLNPDARPSPGCLRRMYDNLCADAVAGCTAPAVVGVENRSYRRRPKAFQKFVIYGALRKLPLFRTLMKPILNCALDRHYFPATVKDGEEVYSVAGSCMMIKTAAFLDIGGLDENTFLFEEELILAERLQKKNWRVIASPSAKCAHNAGHSMPKSLAVEFRYFLESERYLISEYYHWSAPKRLMWRLARETEYLLLRANGALQSLRKKPRAR
ncbi:MAG TPA: glycosyltransferase family 2 protein [Bryobacteraceae bacterium]|nr:glycosyltransferase family 2 protein [Bryobacteraceae bacterium]